MLSKILTKIRGPPAVRCSLAAVFTGGNGRGMSIGRLHGRGRRWRYAGMQAMMEQRRRAGEGGRGASEG
jgi:hypothetical protein